MNFLYSNWVALPLGTRQRIAELFGIKKKRSIHVSNNLVLDDGYEIKDIDDALTVGAIQSLLDTKEEGISLWNRLIFVAEGGVITKPDTPVISEVVVEELTPKPNAKKTKKRE